MQEKTTSTCNSFYNLLRVLFKQCNTWSLRNGSDLCAALCLKAFTPQSCLLSSKCGSRNLSLHTHTPKLLLTHMYTYPTEFGLNIQYKSLFLLLKVEQATGRSGTKFFPCCRSTGLQRVLRLNRESTSGYSDNTYCSTMTIYQHNSGFVPCLGSELSASGTCGK